jgi:hypothetical protein
VPRNWEWTEEQKRALSEKRKGAANPVWKGGHSQDPDVKAAYLREWRKRREAYVRDREYQRRFGITLADYERMAEGQEHKCAICRQPDNRRRLEVDHCHQTKRVRGLLCGSCNRTLGMFEDRQEWLDSASRYLRR